MTPPPAIEAITETAIYADDIERTAAFYQEVFGLEPLGKQVNRHVFFRVGPGSVLLIFRPVETLKGEHLPPHGTSGRGHFAFGIRPELLNAWRQRLTELDITIEKEITWERGGQSIYFRDPAGNSVELATPGIWGTPAGW